MYLLWDFMSWVLFVWNQLFLLNRTLVFIWKIINSPNVVVQCSAVSALRGRYWNIVHPVRYICPRLSIHPRLWMFGGVISVRKRRLRLIHHGGSCLRSCPQASFLSWLLPAWYLSVKMFLWFHGWYNSVPMIPYLFSFSWQKLVGLLMQWPLWMINTS